MINNLRVGDRVRVARLNVTGTVKRINSVVGIVVLWPHDSKVYANADMYVSSGDCEKVTVYDAEWAEYDQHES